MPEATKVPVNALFRDRLIESLAEKGDTRVVAAKAIGVTTKGIQYWTAGFGMPTGSALIRLCDYLDKSADWLLGREE